MPRRIITEEELREAAREVLEYELAIFDSYNDYPDHIFHGKFRLNMAALLHEVKRGAVKAAKYSMGFTFYAQQCIAAVLLIFTLSCIAMPETVLAGYHKLIEVIETVFEEYTEYRYRVNDDGGIEETFKPLKLGYLPEGMEEVKNNRMSNSVNKLFVDNQNNYFKIYQCLVAAEDSTIYNTDTVTKRTKSIKVDSEIILLVFHEKEIGFSGLYKSYHISGQTDLNEKELIKILNSLEI